MKVITALLVGIALVGAILTDEEEWNKFKASHNKRYLSESEDAHRFQIFKENLKKIREHNAKFEKGEVTYKMGINQFADMTPEEFKAIYGRGVLPPKNHDGNKPEGA